jgi:hypothetical protein
MEKYSSPKGSEKLRRFDDRVFAREGLEELDEILPVVGRQLGFADGFDLGGKTGIVLEQAQAAAFHVGKVSLEWPGSG